MNLNLEELEGLVFLGGILILFMIIIIIKGIFSRRDERKRTEDEKGYICRCMEDPSSNGRHEIESVLRGKLPKEVAFATMRTKSLDESISLYHQALNQSWRQIQFGKAHGEIIEFHIREKVSSSEEFFKVGRLIGSIPQREKKFRKQSEELWESLISKGKEIGMKTLPEYSLYTGIFEDVWESWALHNGKPEIIIQTVEFISSIIGRRPKTLIERGCGKLLEDRSEKDGTEFLSRIANWASYMTMETRVQLAEKILSVKEATPTQLRVLDCEDFPLGIRKRAKRIAIQNAKIGPELFKIFGIILCGEKAGNFSLSDWKNDKTVKALWDAISNISEMGSIEEPIKTITEEVAKASESTRIALVVKLWLKVKTGKVEIWDTEQKKKKKITDKPIRTSNLLS